VLVAKHESMKLLNIVFYSNDLLDEQEYYHKH